MPRFPVNTFVSVWLLKFTDLEILVNDVIHKISVGVIWYC